jgi:AAA15 family ATPase/GTPase
MKLIAFQIKNFRSIVNTGWCNLAPDNITGLIGQNESGKTAILEALYSFHKQLFQDFELPQGIDKLIKKKGRINLKRIWDNVNSSKIVLEEEDISRLFQKEEPREENDKKNLENGKEEIVHDDNSPQEVTEEAFIEIFFELIPDFEFFEDFSSLLPNTIDLEDLKNNNTEIEGYRGARNLLTVAGMDLNFL